MLQYFVRDSIEFADLSSIGLAHICEDASKFVKRQVLSCIGDYRFAIGSTETISEPRIGYFPTRQEVQDFGTFAIARDTEAKFDPACLLRSTSISSHPWKDWQGNTWQIPIARRWVDGSGGPQFACELPRYLTIESNTWVYGNVLPKYKSLWDLASKFFDGIVDSERSVAPGENYKIAVPSIDDVCNFVFGSNYRVSQYEMAFLKSLTIDSVFTICNLVIDQPGLESIQKKTV
jgi:hypothetical protein